MSVDLETSLYINKMMEEVAEVEESHGFWDQNRWNGETYAEDIEEGKVFVCVSLEEYRRLVIMEKVALAHAELSEFVEGMRKDPEAISSKTPEHSAGAEELADAIIRILGIAKRLGYNIGSAVVDKSAYNETRPYKHGKRF